MAQAILPVLLCGIVCGLRRQKLILDSDDLARLDGLDTREAGGHKRQQVLQAIGPGMENDNCNLAGAAFSRVWFLRGWVFPFSYFLREGRPPFIDTLVNENAHLGTRKQEVLCFFESGNG